MTQRTVRVNELVRREIGEILRTRYQTQSVMITITGVDVMPDLRQARIYYSVLGDNANVIEAEAFFHANHKEIRRELSRRIVLKYLPRLDFVHDTSLERGDQLNRLIDELDIPSETQEDDPR